MRCRAARTRAAGLMPGLAPPDLHRVSLRRLVLRVTGGQLAHRDQGQTEVANLCQQPVERGLIREQASDDRLRAIVADLETAKPVRPPVIKDAVDADLVEGGLPRAVHAWSSSRLAEMAWQAPRRNHGNGEAPFTATGRVTGFPVQARPFVTRSSLRTAIAILRSVCLASPGTLRTAARSARHPKVPVRVESSDEGAGHSRRPDPLAQHPQPALGQHRRLPALGACRLRRARLWLRAMDRGLPPDHYLQEPRLGSPTIT